MPGPSVQWFVAIWHDCLSGWELLGIYSTREVAEAAGSEWSASPHGEVGLFIFGKVPVAMPAAALLRELRSVRHPKSPHHSWTYADFCNRIDAASSAFRVSIRPGGEVTP